MSTEIKITPAGGVEETIVCYDSCRTSNSVTERAGSFSITIPFLRDQDISKYTIGADVKINQDGHLFRGYVTNPPRKSSYLTKTVILEGSDYTAKTQKIIVNESYIEMPVDFIVDDLFAKYVPWATRNKIQTNDRLLTIRFPDTFLWDAMEQICKLVGFDWYIDYDLDVNFFQTANSLNPIVLTPDKYRKDSANFAPSAEKLVNKLWVIGTSAISLPFVQNINVSGNTPIPLLYRPRVTEDESITVVIDGVQRSLGIQNIVAPGTKDFLINANEKLLVPDLVTSGSGTITYRYEYPLRMLLENEASQAQYGLYEDKITVDTSDKKLAKEMGVNYLDKYSHPVINGSIEPNDGIYKAGELIKVEIPSLNMNDYLVIKEITYESINQIGKVSRKLTLESAQRDVAAILKDINKRLNKIESVLFGSSNDSVVEKYKVYLDTMICPKLIDNFEYKLHQYHICSPNLVCSPNLKI